MSTNWLAIGGCFVWLAIIGLGVAAVILEWTSSFSQWACSKDKDCDCNEIVHSSIFDIFYIEALIHNLFPPPYYVLVFGEYTETEWTRELEFKWSSIATLVFSSSILIYWSVGIMSGGRRRVVRIPIVFCIIAFYVSFFIHILNSGGLGGQITTGVLGGIAILVSITSAFFIEEPTIFNVITGITYAIIIIYTLYRVIRICKPKIECNTIKEKNDCLWASKICLSDPDKLSEECGSCHPDEDNKDDKDDKDFASATNITACGEKGGEWTSQMSSCYWISDSEDNTNTSCVYEMNKCSDPKADCSVFQTTNVFEECCGIDNWEKFMDKETLESIKDDNKKLDLSEEEEEKENIQGEYTLKRASSSEFHRRDELEKGLYD